MPEQPTTRCGYVALVGRPNVGKSTLLNRFLGMKLSITSRKPQTTRHNLLGVDTQGSDQIVFVDTPGIHDPKSRAMNRYMVRSALSALKDVDVVLWLLEHERFTNADQRVLEAVLKAKRPVIVALNKVDRLARKEALLPAIDRLRRMAAFQGIVPIAALSGEGLETLRALIVEALPERDHLFPEDQITDQSERFLVAEIVREKLTRRLGEELPYALEVAIEHWQEAAESVDIAANIYVERPGQKQIVIGRQGEKLKAIGQEAREAIEALLERRVMLRLWVKVRSGWSNDARALKQFGYGQD